MTFLILEMKKDEAIREYRWEVMGADRITSFFLDASSHLYKRVCPSVGPSVRPSVRMYVTLL